MCTKTRALETKHHFLVTNTSNSNVFLNSFNGHSANTTFQICLDFFLKCADKPPSFENGGPLKQNSSHCLGFTNNSNTLFRFSEEHSVRRSFKMYGNSAVLRSGSISELVTYLYNIPFKANNTSRYVHVHLMYGSQVSNSDWLTAVMFYSQVL